MDSKPHSRPQLFIVDDDVGFVHAAAEIAREEGFEITVAGTLAQGVSRLAKRRFDMALIDLTLPDGSGLELLDQFDLDGDTQIVLVTGQPTVESALRALHSPVLDYVIKPMPARRLRELLASAVAQRKRAVPHGGGEWHGLAGRSPHIATLRREILRVAGTDAAVLLQGESGVGKELAALALHAESGRPGNFVALNCGAIPPDLLSSQLFGHEKGSFTGAGARHHGLFEQARHGTLFLDEITEMPPYLQVHLLRALETRTIRRVGGTEEVPVDVRIIAATNRSPAQAVEQGQLREDLFYRLAEFPIHLPPLRDRPEDVLPIAESLLARLNHQYGTQRRFPRDIEAQLLQYGWPGNVRELKNVVQRAYILADDDIVRPDVDRLRTARPVAETPSTITFAVGTPLAEIERRMLFKTLAFFDNNKARTAEALGVTTKTIYNRLAHYQALAKGGGDADPGAQS
jgi:DNA-binding NtrC family response regulator